MRVDATRALRLLRVAPGDDERAAAETLGPDHALSRLLARRRTLRGQIAVTSTLLVLAAFALAVRGDDALVVVGAAVIVELVLLTAVAYFRGRTRDVTQELIAAGEDAALSVGVVRDERRRLASGKVREHLARSLERLLHDAQRWHKLLPAYRPPEGSQLLRFAASEVRDVVGLLRDEGADVRGVALTARFLMDGYSSPLYAGNAARLREELNRIRYLLTPADSSSGVPAAA